MEISSRTVQIKTPDGAMPAFLAQPHGAGRSPAVVVVMEAFGLNDHIRDVASRLAREGYVALAPDLYYREPITVVSYDNVGEAIRLMSALWDEKIVQDMGATLAYLQQHQSVRVDRLGMTGFCMGGRVTFLTACRNPAIKAAVPFYGGGIGSVMQPGERTPRAPLEFADQLAAAVLLFFGGDDPFIPLDEVERIKTRLAELGKDAETIVYPGAPHGFFCSERDSYRPDAAHDAWQRLLSFLDRHLKV